MPAEGPPPPPPQTGRRRDVQGTLCRPLWGPVGSGSGLGSQRVLSRPPAELGQEGTQQKEPNIVINGCRLPH